MHRPGWPVSWFRRAPLCLPGEASRSRSAQLPLNCRLSALTRRPEPLSSPAGAAHKHDQGRTDMRDRFAGPLLEERCAPACCWRSSAAVATAGEIRVVTVGALRNALTPLGADYTKQSGDKVTYMFTNPANLKQVLGEGKYDAIIAAASRSRSSTSRADCRLAATSRRCGSASAWR